MDKKGILVLSFGTVNRETREKCIYNIQNNIKEMFPEYVVYVAITSRFIFKKIKSMGEDILNTELALDKFREYGIRQVYVQPTLVTDGEEYNRIIKSMEEYRADFDIKVGKPLLYSERDYEKMSDILDCEAQNDCTNIFMGHGNDNFETMSYIKMQKVVSARSSKKIYIAAVEGSPSFEQVAEKIGAGEKVHLQPMMIVAGEHAKNDMAGNSEESLKSRLTAKGCDVVCTIKGLGEIKAVSEIAAQHIRDMLLL